MLATNLDKHTAHTDETHIDQTRVKKPSDRFMVPLYLTQATIKEMIDRRRKFHLVKFRTTCPDPVPNH